MRTSSGFAARFGAMLLLAIAPSIASAQSVQFVGDTGIPGHDSGGLRPPRIAVHGTTIYVATEDGSYVVDASNPALPTVVQGSVLGSSTAVEVDGDRLYLAMPHLEIYDISNPFAPSLLGSYLPGSSTISGDIEIEGGRAYFRQTQLGVADPALICLDVSNPATPTQLGFALSIDPNSDGLEVRNRVVYEVSAANLRIFNFANAVYPTLEAMIQSHSFADVGTLPTGHIVLGIAEQVKAGGLEIYDGTASPSRDLLGAIYRFEPVERLAIQGSICYTVDSNLLRIYDLSAPQSPIWLTEAQIVAPRDLAVGGDKVYVVTGSALHQFLVFQTSGVSPL